MSKIDKVELINSLYSSLNKKFEQKSYKLTDENSVAFVKDLCSTGCTPLDVAISNRVNGGIPYGKFTLLEGLSSSGKSLLAATILANNQKRKGISIWMDNEYSVDDSFLRAIGVDLDNLLYSNYEYIEDMMDATETLIYEIREQDKNIPIVVVWDSIAGAKSYAQGKSGYEKDGYATEKAIIMSQKLPKLIPIINKFNVALVATQQLRANMNAMAFGEKYVPASGGMSAQFYAHVQVRLNQIGKIKNKDGLIVGAKNKAVVKKTRLGPPMREAEYETYFDSGIDDKKACLEILEKYKIVKKGGAYKKWSEALNKSEFGELVIDYTHNFQLPEWRTWMENEEFYKYISEKIAEFSITKYKGFMGKDDELSLEQNEEPFRDIEDEIDQE